MTNLKGPTHVMSQLGVSYVKKNLKWQVGHEVELAHVGLMYNSETSDSWSWFSSKSRLKLKEHFIEFI